MYTCANIYACARTHARMRSCEYVSMYMYIYIRAYITRIYLFTLCTLIYLFIFQGKYPRAVLQRSKIDRAKRRNFGKKSKQREMHWPATQPDAFVLQDLTVDLIFDMRCIVRALRLASNLYNVKKEKEKNRKKRKMYCVTPTNQLTN